MMAILNPGQPNEQLRYGYGRGSAYESELRLTEVLSALLRDGELIHPDHRLFQIEHLKTELSWVAIHDALCILNAALDKDNLVGATRALARATQLAEQPVTSLQVLIDALPQASFLAMRPRFAAGASGLDSPGARNMRKAGRATWQAFERALAAHNVTLTDLVDATETDYAGEDPLALLAEVMLRMHRFDTRIVEWRRVHLTLVRMLLGGHPHRGDDHGPRGEAPTSMRGRPTTDLERLADQTMFPQLWQHSTTRYHASAGGGYR